MKRAKRAFRLSCITTMGVTWLATLLAWPGSARAAGELDVTFDVDGKVTTDFGGSEEGANGLAIQADGKIVVAGDSDFNFALARYNPDGSLDLTFDTDGKVTTDFGGGEEAANGLAIQANGKIVVAGFSDIGGFDFVLARYNPDGSLDLTFDTDGKVTTDFGGFDKILDVVLQADGKIVAAGRNDSRFALARYNPDGSLDLTFDVDGMVTTDFAGGTDIASGVAIQVDGKIVAAGFSGDDFALARYEPDGSLDLTFDTDGKVTTDFGGFDVIHGVVLQADGKIVVAGFSDLGGFDFALARYEPDGSLDPTFDTDGTVTTDFGGDDRGLSLAIQSDGKIVVAGDSNLGGFDFALARYEPDGTLDPTFDTDGKVTTDFGGSDVANSLAIQADGKIVVAGFSDIGGDDFALARYLGVLFVACPVAPHNVEFVETVLACDQITAANLLAQVIAGGLVAPLPGFTLVIDTPLGSYAVGLHDVAFRAQDGVGGLSADVCALEVVVVQGFACEGATGPAGGAGDQGPPGPAGADGLGLNCWDLNGDGVPDPQEDVNGDGAFNALDCQGQDGSPGGTGGQGPGGSAGPGGLNCWDLDGDGVPDPEEDVNGDGVFDALDCQLHCWDLNGDGVANPEEDINGDGVFDALDCQGQDGAPGLAGQDGAPGPAGPSGPPADSPAPTQPAPPPVLPFCAFGAEQAVFMTSFGLLLMGFVQRRRHA